MARARTSPAGWAVALLVAGAAAGSLAFFEDKEGQSVALLTVALRGGGLRKCSGAAVGARAVLAAARCLDGADEARLVQVKVAAAAAAAAASKRANAAWAPGPPKKRPPKRAPQEEPMQTRFSRPALRARGGAVVLLRLTAPLEGAGRRAAPLAAERPPLSGSARCRLLSWGATSRFGPEARLGRWAVRAGNWSACRQGAGAGAGGVCAVGDGCVGAAAGAVLLCQGALVALAGPPAPAPLQDPCGDGPLRLHAVAGMQDWLQKFVPDLTTAPSGLRGASAAAAAAAGATPRRKRRGRGTRPRPH